MPTWLQHCILVVSIHCIKFGGEIVSITDILSGKLPVAKVVARESYNANIVAALHHCSNHSLYQVGW